MYLIFNRAFKTTVGINHLGLFCAKQLGIGGQLEADVHNPGLGLRSIARKYSWVRDLLPRMRVGGNRWNLGEVIDRGRGLELSDITIPVCNHTGYSDIVFLQCNLLF